jgi:signal transduction histidine kinase
MADDVVGGYSGVDADVTVADDGSHPQVMGDPDALRRVAVNLIDNAVRYATSSVNVGVAGSNGRAVLTVADDGPGIPADKREAVFDRFVRLDTARARDTGGTGLGLSIVREIVTGHGGTVQLSDNEPGVLVTVSLPAGRGRRPESAAG